MRRFSFIAVPIFICAAAASAAACRSEAPPVTPAAPMPSPVTPQDAVGLWRISATGEARSCLLALNLNASDGGYGVVLEDCRLPDLARARSWRLTPNGLELRAADGVVLTRLRRETVDAYKTEGAGPAYRMERAPLV